MLLLSLTKLMMNILEWLGLGRSEYLFVCKLVCLLVSLFFGWVVSMDGSSQWMSLLNGWVFSMDGSFQWMGLFNGWVFSMDESFQWISLPTFFLPSNIIPFHSPTPITQFRTP